MSSTFSFQRLGKLITKQFFENSRLYIFTVLAMFGLLALVFTFWLLVGGTDYREETTYIIFLVGLFIAGCVFASMSFDMLGNKDKGIYWLSVPATHLEKLICTIFYSTIVFTLAYCLCFFIVKSIAVSLLLGYIEKHSGITYQSMPDLNQGPREAIRYFIYGYFAVQSIYLLGSVYFRRYSFIVTTVAGACLIFAFIFYLKFLQDGMLGNWSLIQLRKYDPSTDSFKLYSISPAVVKVLKFTLQFAWAPVLWTVTWFRLREKQL